MIVRHCICLCARKSVLYRMHGAGITAKTATFEVVTRRFQPPHSLWIRITNRSKYQLRATILYSTRRIMYYIAIQNVPQNRQ